MSKRPAKDMPGNPYEPVEFSSPQHAQAQALMALAYEQRTSALVALLTGTELPDDIAQTVRDQVYGRLHINADTSKVDPYDF